MLKVFVNNSLDIGVAIKKTRKEQGISQREAAALCGVGVRFLSELENGKPSLEINKVIHVAKMFGLRLFFENNEG